MADFKGIKEKLLKQAEEAGIETAFDRAQKSKPCPFGKAGICCRICNMGPCRINPNKQNESTGMCGATAGVIVARNFARQVASGTAAHSDHGRAVVETFKAVANGELKEYEIKDERKLVSVAQDFDIDTKGKKTEDIAKELADKAAMEFGGTSSGEMQLLKRAPEARQEIWRKAGIWPRSIDREVVEILHRTTMGVDQDPMHIYMAAARCSLSDGWGGSMLATELQDIMFGTPNPVKGEIDIGVIKKDEVNVVVHGHEPLLSEMIVIATRDKELLEYAKSKGANGISVSGVCCTANELLMRHGIPVAGNFAHQELVLTTGAIEAMVVDVQCLMQALPKVAKHYHTHIITTSPRAKIEGADHMEFHEDHALETAKQIVKKAIDNYPNRKEVKIPEGKDDMVVGFSHETINYMLGGKFRASYRPLNDNIINGKILGVAGVVGCDLPTMDSTQMHIDLVKELIANNILVIQSGCSAIACSREGLLQPEAIKYAGKTLREVCQAVGIPPVLHTGSCVDNARILVEGTAIVKEGGLGSDLSDLPAVGACPTWMNEKAIAIGQYFVSSGVHTIFGPQLNVTGSDQFMDILFNKSAEHLKATWAHTQDISQMAQMMIDHIQKQRDALGLTTSQERVLYDMEMRRDLSVE